MLLTMLKSKIHRARLTMTDLHYEGSIGIDEDILAAADILPNEQVSIWNVTTGGRLVTYAIPAARGSREFQLNGAAARGAAIGDIVIIAAFAQIDAAEARSHKPTVLLMDADNSISRRH